jgi:hypothetical protein
LGLKLEKKAFFSQFKPIFLIILAYLFFSYSIFSPLPSPVGHQINDQGTWCQSAGYLGDFAPGEKKDTHSGQEHLWCCLAQAPSLDLAILAGSWLMPEPIAYQNAANFGKLTSRPPPLKYANYFQSRAPPALTSSFGNYV